MWEVIIYALSDPRKPGLVRYVGKTKQSLRRRLHVHVAHRNAKPCHRTRWMQKLFKDGLIPRIWPLELCSESNWQEREIFWVRFFKPLGLINSTDGGDGSNGSKRSLEAIKKTRLKLLGRKPPPHVIEASRRAHLGKKVPQTPEQLLRRQAYARKYLRWPPGKKRPSPSAETRLKLRAAQKGKIRPHVVMAGGKPVECVETGERFISIWRAAQAHKTTCAGIRRSIQRGYATHGLHWKLVNSEVKEVECQAP